MLGTGTLYDEAWQTGVRQLSETQTVVRKFGILNLLGGLLGCVDPAVKDNDDGGLINTNPGLFLGIVAVNGPHALLHVLFGVLSLRASRGAESARKYMELSAIFFGAFAVIGWQRFGFERDIHMIAGLAVNGWENLTHILFFTFSLLTVIQSDSQS